MKTLRMIGMALMAVLMCLNFASCSNEEMESKSDETVTVKFNCVGDIINVQNSPLGRTTGDIDDIYGIQVYTSTGSQLIPYAYGVFTSLEDVTLELLKSQKYTIKAMVVIDGFDGYRFDGMNTGGLDYSEIVGQFYKSTTDYLTVDRPNGYDNSYNKRYYPYEAYYGSETDYTPINGGTINIETKRVSFGIKFVAEGLNGGSLSVEFGNIADFELTEENADFEKIYIYPTYFDRILALLDNYQDIDCSITLTEDDGDPVFLGSYTIRVKPNVQTIVTINANSSLTTSNGFNLTIDNTPMDEEEYIIDDKGMNPVN